MPDQDPSFVLPDTVEVVRDVVYGTGGGRDLTSDLFLPETPASSRPAIVFIHGGGWCGGNKGQFCRQAAHLATQGYVGLCIEYRLSGEARFPAAVEDCKCAVRFLKAKAGEYGIDAGRVATAGGSAGGHLASLLGVSQDVPALEGTGGWAGESSNVHAVVSFNGVGNMRFQVAYRGAQSAASEFLGGTPDEVPDRYDLASPVTHVSFDSAPFLLLHGAADDTVPYDQSVELHKKLDTAGVRADLFTAEGAGHGFFNRPPWFQPALERMEQFLGEVIQ